MRRVTAVLVLAVMCAGAAAMAADAAKVPFDTYSGYFVSNKFEPDAAESFLVVADQSRFERVFGVAMVMNDRSHRLAKDAFQSKIVVAAVKRGKAVWEYKVEDVSVANGVVQLRYTTTAKQSDSASFACPLIVSIPKGIGTSVQFVENGKAVKTVAIAADKASARPAITCTVLYDNVPFDERLTANWGFACLVTGTERTILFDAGAKGPVLLENMEKLGVKPGAVELLAISHNHGDHTGGLLALLEKNSRVTAYLPPSCEEAGEGATKSLAEQVRATGAKVVVVRKPTKICRGVFLVGPIGDKIIEQALAIQTGKGLVVLTGCSHPGIVEMVQEIKRQLKQDVYMVYGGMHLLKHSDDDVKAIIAQLKEAGVRQIGPTHCTGDKAIALFKESLGDGYVATGVGRVFRVP